MTELWDDFDQPAAPAAPRPSASVWDDFDAPVAAVRTSPAPNLGTVKIGDFEHVADSEVIVPDGPFGGVSSTMDSSALLGGVPDYSDAFRPTAQENGGVGKSALRAMVGRVPDLIGGALELPANANEAVIRALGMEPDADGVFGAIRGGLRGASDAVRGLGYSEEMDAVNYGQPRVSGGELVEAFKPNRAPTMSELVTGEAPEQLTMGDRAGRIGTFALDQGVASLPDMLATLNPAALAAYIGSRTNEVAETRAGNDNRENVSLGDIGIAAPAATFEALLERFTTMRLLPGGTTLATPGALAAIKRIAKEVGIQAPLGGIEEVAPYLAETVGTETGASADGALESFVGGVVGEGAIGGGVATVKEGANALRRRGEVGPVGLADAPSPQAAPVAPVAPAPEATPDLAAEDTSDIEALLLQNLPAITEALGLGDIAPADVAAAVAPEATPESAPDPDARFRRPADTAAQAVQAPAEQSAPVPVGADLKLGEDAPRPVAPAPQPERAPEPTPVDSVPPPDRLGDIDDTPDAPVEIKYGRKRKPPTAEEMAARDTQLRERYAPAELVEAAPAEEASHADPGEAAEPVTPEVIAEAVEKSADNTPRNLKQSREWLLGEVDKADAGASDVVPMPSVTQGELARMTPAKREAYIANREQVDAAGYVTFDVPGDGKFKVRNTKALLADFRAKVAKSQGFREKVPAPRGPTLGTGMSAAERARVMGEAETVEEASTPEAAPRKLGKAYMAEVKAAQQRAAEAAKAAPTETITPADDTLLGENDSGDPVYERKNGDRYRMRGGRVVTGGLLQTTKERLSERPEQADVAADAGTQGAPNFLRNTMRDMDRAVFQDFVTQGVQNDGQRVLDAIAAGDAGTLRKIRDKYQMEATRSQGGGGAGPGKIKSARRGVVSVHASADAAVRRLSADEAKTPEPEGLDSVESAEPAFYSALSRAVTDAKGAPKRGDATAWKGWLDGAQRRGEFKAEERDWLGVDAWLESQPSVTREQLAAFVAANEVAVEEVTLGEGVDSRLPTGWRVEPNEDGDGFELLDAQGVMVGEGRTEAEAIDDGQDREERADAGAPKFSAYQTPGGENYRELLLTLPVAREFPGAPDFDTWLRDQTWYHHRGSEAESRRLYDVWVQRNTTGTDAPSYKSSHFDQPNILAHVRFNERTDADGKRVLFLEEVQSDWHQAGRKQGYKDGVRADAPMTAKLWDNGVVWEVSTQSGEFVSNITPSAVNGEGPFKPITAEQAIVEARRRLREQPQRTGNAHAVPDAPFKTTWPMLAFKRMVRYAAENGFDRIAFTTGEQQAARYDLSKQISRVTLSVTSGGASKAPDGPFTRGTLDAYDLKGQKVIAEFIDDPARIEDFVGKEVAQKLLDQPGVAGRVAGMGSHVRTVEGLDLKVGGEGMKGFYDRILPNEINKWAKRFGARVAQTRVAGVSVPSAEAMQRLVDVDSGLLDAVHSIDITPAMRDAALSGQPLFNTLDDADLTPAERASFARQSGGNRLREAVDAALGPVAEQVKYLASWRELPARLRDGVGSRLQQRGGSGQPSALFDPKTGDVYLFTDANRTPEIAVFNVLHEIAGHKGLRAFLGEDLNKALDLAAQNPTVMNVAEAIALERNIDASTDAGQRLAVEEALAELAAAVRSGNYAIIKDRYGVDVPAGIRERVKAAIDNFLKRLKALLGRTFDQEFSDADVRALLENAWQAAGGEGGSIGGMAESVSSEQTQTPAFRKWFGDSVIVDGEGKPLVVYHGTTADEFDSYNVPAFFTSQRDGAEWFMQGEEGRIEENYLALRNPLDITTRAGAAELIRIARKAGVEIESDINDNVEAWDFYAPEIGEHSDYEGSNPPDLAYIPAVRAALEAAGYDGLKADDTLENTSMPVWVAFKPSQIKSATANSGAFDPGSDSILEAVDYTPEQQAFMRKAGLSGAVDTRTSLQRVTDWALGKKPDIDGDSLIQSTLDQFHGIKRAVNEKGVTDAERNAYLAARQIQTGSTMEAILLYGAPKLEGGALRVNRDVPGLLQALGPVGKTMPQFLGWMVAVRARALKKQGRENLMSDADIAAGLALATGHEAAFKQAAGDYLRLKNAILDLGEQTGTIDPEARAMWDSAEYIPFYREKDGASAGPGTRQGLANQSSGIRKLRGGESALTDPLANIIQNFTRLVDSAMKNRATLLAVDTLGEPYFRKAALAMKAEVIPLDQVKKHLIATGTDPATVDALPDAALKGVAKMLAVKAPEGDDIVRVMRNGKAEYYHVDDPLLLRALTAFNEVPTHPGVKPFVWAKQMLTAGATATPEFLVANGLRDTGEAWATAGHKFIPVADTLRGAWQNVRESELTQDLMMAGSAFHSGYFHTGRNEDTAKAIARALRKHGVGDSAIKRHISTLYNPKRWWDLYRSGMEASEMGSRIMLAQRTMEAGGSFLEAAHEAKDFLDFSMRGDDRFVQFFTSVLPFLNARLQGGYRLARVGTTKGRRGKLAGRMALIAMASTSLYLWNMAMYAAGYEELKDYDKDAYWHIAPGTEHHIRIPKPFEIGLVAGTFVERMMGAVQYQLTDGIQGDRPRETWEAFVRGIVHTMAIDPLPQLVRPTLEVQTNQNRFFDSPIENLGDQSKAPEDRFNATTSDTMKALSRGMTALLGDDKALSPKQLQHLWRGYTAGIGDYLLDSTDWVLRQATDAPPRPELALRDFPLIGRFARGGNPAASTKYMDEFYTLRDKAQQQSDRVKQAVLDGDARKAERIEAEFGWLLGARVDSKRAKGGFMHEGVRALGETADMVSAMRKADQMVYGNRDQTPAIKRWMLDEYAKTRNDAVRKAVRQLNEAERRGSYKAPTPPREPSASSVPESRRAEYTGIGKGGRATVAPDVLKGARNAPALVMVGDYSELPSAGVRSSLDAGALGVYDPAERKAYVVMGLEPAVAKFVAYHEIAGHHGLQGALGEDYESTLNRAMQNPTVDRLAKAMQERAYTDVPNRLAMTEEALSELAAARRTGDYARIESEWGVAVPSSAQPGLTGMMARVGQLTRRKLADLTGEEPAAFNDEQVYSLIEDAWRYVERG